MNSAAAADSGEPFTVVAKLSHDLALDRAHDVELSKNLAFVPGKGGSLAIINVADPHKPELMWFRRDPRELTDAETVLPMGDHLLLGTCDFLTLNVSRPSQPVFLGKLSDQRIDRINGMVRRGKTVFAANKSGWIDAFDISDVNSPQLFGARNVQQEFGLNDPHDIDAFGPFVVIVCPEKFGVNPAGKLAVFRVMHDGNHVSASDDWVLEGKCISRKLVGANRVQVSGSYAFAAGSLSPRAQEANSPGDFSDFSVVDLSDPKQPRVVASVPFLDKRGPNGLTVAGNVAFLAGGQTVDAIDVSDPLHPVRLGSHVFPPLSPKIERTDNAHDLVYRNGHLYVSCQSDNSFVILRVNESRILQLAESAPDHAK